MGGNWMGGNWYGGNWFGGNWFGGNWDGGGGGGGGGGAFATRTDHPLAEIKVPSNMAAIYPAKAWDADLHSLLILPEFFGELTVPDVDGHDARRAALEEAVGKTAGGGADVQTNPARDGEPSRGKKLEGVLEFVAAAGDEARRPLDLEGDRLVELGSRLVVPGDEAGDHESLRLAARLREPALHEQNVEPLLHRPGRLAGCERSASSSQVASS